MLPNELAREDLVVFVRARSGDSVRPPSASALVFDPDRDLVGDDCAECVLDANRMLLAPLEGVGEGGIGG